MNTELIPLTRLRQAFFQTVTGGLYRTPEPVHRNLADLRLLAIPSLRYSNCRVRSVLRKRFIIDRVPGPRFDIFIVANV